MTHVCTPQTFLINSESQTIHSDAQTTHWENTSCVVGGGMVALISSNPNITPNTIFSHLL